MGVPRKMPLVSAGNIEGGGYTQNPGIQYHRHKESYDMTTPLKAPMPYPGGKSTAAAAVWARLGDTPNYVESHCGSAALTLARPHDLAGKTETINDADGLLVNSLRSIALDPERAAYWCDWPVSEADLTARHLWLKAQRDDLTARLFADPEYCDPKAAGWWLWGAASWIGDGWCVADGPWIAVDGKLCDRRTIGSEAEGVVLQAPNVTPGPYHTPTARGIQRYRDAPGVPKQEGVGKRIPKVGANGVGSDSGMNGVQRKEFRESPAALLDYFERLATRFRRVRILCGDWRRVVKPSITTNHGLTALFMDPPYPSAEHDMAYHGDNDIWHDAARWAIENGDNPLLRIAVCGYHSEATDALFPPTWERYRWEARGGYSNQKADGRGRENAKREVIFFSPHCIDAKTDYGPLFEELSS